MTAQDMREFNEYLRQCSDAQVEGAWEKETEADREDYAELAWQELIRRDLR